MNIALSGGGVKGIAYVGVYKKLVENNIKIKSLSGTSIGAIFCVLISLYNPDEVEHITKMVQLDRVLTFDTENPFCGLSSGKNIDILTRKVLTHKGLSCEITIGELVKITGINLYIAATDVFNQQSVFISNEEKVVDAVRYSVSIPFIFESIGGYVDGCITKNLPIEVFPIEDTLGFYFKNNKKKTDSYFFSVMSCIQRKGSSYEIEFYKALGYKLIEIEVNVSALDLEVDSQTINSLIQSGYTCF